MNRDTQVPQTKVILWGNYLAQYSEKFHFWGMFWGATLYSAWSWFDYILLPHLWKDLLIFRLIGTFIMFLMWFLYRLKVVTIVMPMFTTVFAASIGVAWMMPFTEGVTMALYFSGFSVCIIVAGMFLFSSYFPYFLVLIVSVLTAATGFYLQGKYSVTYVLINGGLAFSTLCIFSIFLFYSKLKMLKENFNLMRKVESQNEVLEQYANIDPLTNTYNRRYLDKVLEKVAGDQGVYSVLFCDINELKRINDTYGHQAGDKYIVECCNVIKKVCRKTDIVCRQGGDEIIVICPATNQEQAEILASRIMQREAKIICKNEKTGEVKEELVLMSIGLATSDTYSKEQIIKAADDQMQLKKQQWYQERGQKYR